MGFLGKDAENDSRKQLVFAVFDVRIQALFEGNIARMIVWKANSAKSQVSRFPESQEQQNQANNH